MKEVRRRRRWGGNDVNAVLRYEPQNNYIKILTVLGTWEAKAGGPRVLKPA